MVAAVLAVVGRAGRKSLALLGLSVALLTATVAAAPVQIPLPDLEASGQWSVNPLGLPKDRDAPIRLHGDVRIDTLSGTHPPAVRKIDLELDRDISLATTGLPACRTRREASIRRACRDSRVGEGRAEIHIQFPETEPILSNAPVAVYNTPHKGEFAKFLALLDVAVPVPAAIPIWIAVRRAKGAHGYRLEASVPVIAGGSGSIVSLRLAIGRRWTYEGKRYSLLSGRCSADHLEFRTELSFEDDTLLRSTSVQPCLVKR
jgi:hypothetical protein